MNIIIDTNILFQDPFFRGPKSRVIFDYLEKTRSHLIIPTIARKEMMALYRAQLSTELKGVQKCAESIKKWCYDGTSKIEFHIDIEKETKTYLEFLDGLVHGGGALELPYRDEYLNELVERQINRKKPANDKGEQFRDVIIWLSIKEMLRQTHHRAVFISQNTKQFANVDLNGLHPDLINELSAENLQLEYYPSLDDFIKLHSSKVDFLTAEWIKASLSKQDIESIAIKPIEGNNTVWQNYANRIEIEWTGYLSILGFTDFQLDEFYAYDFEKSEELYLHASYSVELEVEMEYEEAHPMGRRCAYKYCYPEICLNIEGKIRGNKIEELKLEDWDYF